MKNFKLKTTDKILIDSILKKIDRLRTRSQLIAKLDFRTFYQLLTKDEQKLAKKITQINPVNYSFKGPHYGIVPVPKNLIIVKNQQYKERGRIKTIPPQLVPKNAYTVYCRLNQAMEKDISKKILIESSYRSPAYQLIIFLYYLKFYKWNLNKTFKKVALPGYSEHGYPPRQALDFMTVNGIPSDDKPFEFAKTQEYKWLMKYANDYNFYLSYPRGNKWGMMFEPWHWVFVKKELS